MLVLTRKANESIQLGNDIKITILSIESDKIRIGIDAPSSLKILRYELIEETKVINREATDTDLSVFLDIL